MNHFPRQKSLPVLKHFFESSRSNSPTKMSPFKQSYQPTEFSQIEIKPSIQYPQTKRLNVSHTSKT